MEHSSTNISLNIEHIVEGLESPPPTGLMYDERMLFHRDDKVEYHVENPERVSTIYEAFLEYGLVDRCEVQPARPATDNEISTLHDRSLIDKLSLLQEEDEKMRKEIVLKLEKTHDSVYFNEATWEAAHLASGACIDAVEKVIVLVDC